MLMAHDTLCCFISWPLVRPENNTIVIAAEKRHGWVVVSHKTHTHHRGRFELQSWRVNAQTCDASCRCKVTSECVHRSRRSVTEVQ